MVIIGNKMTRLIEFIVYFEYQYFTQNWIDENLKWNPMDYDNITKIHILSSKLWIPGIDDLN